MRDIEVGEKETVHFLGPDILRPLTVKRIEAVIGKIKDRVTDVADRAAHLTAARCLDLVKLEDKRRTRVSGADNRALHHNRAVFATNYAGYFASVGDVLEVGLIGASRPAFCVVKPGPLHSERHAVCRPVLDPAKPDKVTHHRHKISIRRRAAEIGKQAACAERVLLNRIGQPADCNHVSAKLREPPAVSRRGQRVVSRFTDIVKIGVGGVKLIQLGVVAGKQLDVAVIIFC